jgi:large subunit ribosomal protein L24
MKIHTGDTVIVVAGKSKGKQGKVTKVNTKEMTVLVEGVNIVTKHMKPQGGTPGQKVTFEKAIDSSNVMLLDPTTKTPTRVGYRLDEKGNKVRFAKKSGTTL